VQAVTQRTVHRSSQRLTRQTTGLHERIVTSLRLHGLPLTLMVRQLPAVQAAIHHTAHL